MQIEIKARYSGNVFHSGEFENLSAAVLDALSQGISLKYAVLTDADLTDADLAGAVLRGAVLTGAVLTDADLTGAVLTGAVLTGANLTGAVLTDADLTDADLAGAVLTGAVLTDADLTGAVLTGANLTDADLTDADLAGAVLTGAVLTDADLTGAVLTGANLTPIRDDFWAVLCASPSEVFGLREALVNGKINGSAYQGECACLVGTIANVAHCDYQHLPLLKPNASRPSERWFLGLNPGDTPGNSEVAKITLEWLDTFIDGMQKAFGPKEENSAAPGVV